MGQYPWHGLLTIENESSIPVSLQIANAIIKEIHTGHMQPGTKLPGVLDAAQIFKVNKKTIEKAYSELSSQQWVNILPKIGTFISDSLPAMKYQSLKNSSQVVISTDPNYSLEEHHIDRFSEITNGNEIIFNDGLPDNRLIDHALINRTYRSILKLKSYRKLLSYTTSLGDEVLREVLAKYLNGTRGIPCRTENIMITRGSQMALYLSMSLLLRKEDVAIVSDPNYFFADETLKYLNADIKKVKVDKNGIVVDEIEALCNKGKVRLVYVTPHHHHPTTVTLSADRRMHLLELAERYRFAIIEDDYDFDFHYKHNPILPLVSVNSNGSVIYIGSFSKTISPSFRIGYMVAPKKIIRQAADLRKIIDFQGDTILERTIAQLIDQGALQRMVRKSLKEYRKRRDFLCDNLKLELGQFFSFDKPSGGMAIWGKFSNDVCLKNLSSTARENNIVISDGTPYRSDNCLRLGFASLEPAEMTNAVLILKDILLKQVRE